jgi:hypothetical protein
VIRSHKRKIVGVSGSSSHRKCGLFPSREEQRGLHGENHISFSRWNLYVHRCRVMCMKQVIKGSGHFQGEGVTSDVSEGRTACSVPRK